MRKGLIKKQFKAIRNVTCALFLGISVLGTTDLLYADTRPGGCDDMVRILQENGMLEEAIEKGYVSPEAAAEAGITSGGSSESPSTSAPETAPSTSGEGAAPAQTSSGDTSGAPKQEPKKQEVVITESEASGSFVLTTGVSLYDTNKKSNKVSSMEAGTTVNIIAKTSNGLFKTEDGYYFDKAKCVTTDEWEAGWQETGRTDATCTEAGSVTYSNSNNTEVTKTEELPALGHAYEITDTKEPTCTKKGATTYTCSRCNDAYVEETDALGHQKGDWTVTKKPGLFSEGEKVIKCTVCGEVLETKVLEQTCPLPLAGVIAIGVGIVAGIVVIALIIKRKN